MIGPVRRKAFEAACQAYAAASDGRSLIADFADGFGIKATPLKGFSAFFQRVALALITYLVALLLHKLTAALPVLKAGPPPQLDLAWMEGQEIPLQITIDPTIDTVKK